MAYIVMAYIVMACIVMAYIVMACIVTAYIVMAYIVMAFTISVCAGELSWAHEPGDKLSSRPVRTSTPRQMLRALSDATLRFDLALGVCRRHTPKSRQK